MRLHGMLLPLLCLTASAGAWAQEDHGRHHGTHHTDHHADHHVGHDAQHRPDHHAGQHAHSQLHATDAPREPIPALTDEDRAAAFPELSAHTMHGGSIHQLLRLEELELRDTERGSAFSWEGRYWVGSDIDRIWLRGTGEHVDGDDALELEVFYGRRVAAWWDVVAGLRQDFGSGPSRTFAAIGIQGLAPYKFELEATAYFGAGGQASARFEAGYDLLLTNRLIVKPQLELNVYGKADPEAGVGSGLGTLEAALRVRYELTRRFAPYVGIVLERAFSDTADLRRAAGEDREDTQVVAGFRTWF